MKKILFVIPEYSHGGTNKSLENLLSFLDKEKYDISIYSLYEDGGDYYKNIFKPYIIKKSRLYYWLHDNIVTRKFIGLLNRITRRDNYSWLYRREANLIQEKYKYDSIIAYQEGLATQFVSFIKNNVFKIAWYHSPYMAFGEKEKKDFENLYQDYSKIVCVSETFADGMKKLFPCFSSNFVTVYNTLDTKMIRNSSYDITSGFPNKSHFTILSVGRFAEKSQFHLIPEIVYNLSKIVDHDRFKWYIIASGTAYEKITKKEIERYQVQDNVAFLGPKDNPYPFIRNSNLVVCTSISESFSYVIAEAKVLHTPVLSNDFPVAYEVVDETMGWIANIKDMPQVLARIIGNEDGEYTRKKKTALNFEYSNEQILHKIDQLLQN